MQIERIYSEDSACCERHKNKFTDCKEVVVPNNPLSCGRMHVEQTMTCPYERLCEHNSVKAQCNSFLTIRGLTHGFTLLSEQCALVGRLWELITRRLIEAEHNAKLGGACVGTSLSLPCKNGDVWILWCKANQGQIAPTTHCPAKIETSWLVRTACARDLLVFIFCYLHSCCVQ